MTAINTSGRARRVSILGAILCLFIAPAPALAGGGDVLPAGAKPNGYSLADAAAATAYFNEGPRTQDTLPEDFPFQILYTAEDVSTTFTVKAGTRFYVPLVYSDDLDSALWPFPDVNDPAAVSAYYFDEDQLGAEFIKVVVDGKETELGRGYAVGTETTGLPTGGTDYTVVAAFLSPLSRGTHTVMIAIRLTGDDIAAYPEYFPDGVFGFELTFTVIVD